MSLIRYPGAKGRHKQVLDAVREMVGRTGHLTEPFAGSAAVALKMLAEGLVPGGVFLADLDEGLVHLLQWVKDSPTTLQRAIRIYTPAVRDFYLLKEQAEEGGGLSGFEFLVLNRISYGGMGAKAGSPIGGREQSGKYPVGCRWNPDRLVSEVQTVSRLLNSVPCEIVVASWESLRLESAYLDPPYLMQGNTLYPHGLTAEEHRALARRLRGVSEFVLSYDNVETMRRLYSWAVHETYDFHSTNANSRAGGGAPSRELLITPQHKKGQHANR